MEEESSRVRERDVTTESEIRMIQLLGLEIDGGATGQGMHGASRGQKRPNTVSFPGYELP